MSNVIYGQYNSSEYPLKRFYMIDIPREIKKILYKLSWMDLAIFRGGLAFVLLLDVSDYILKDLDMLALDINKDSILEVLDVSADVVYVNKNTFGDSVITAFWKDDKEYFKLDILLCSELPSICIKEIDGRKVNVVSASYVWKNRIEKIAEKELRKHDDQKTLNHYKVARELSNYLLGCKKEIFSEDIDKVDSKLTDVEKVLSELITDKDLKDFMQLQIELIKG